MAHIIGTLWGKSSDEQHQALVQTGFSITHYDSKLETFEAFVQGFEQWPLHIDRAGNVTLDIHNPAFSAPQRSSQSQILLNAAGELTADLWGCEGALALTAQLKQRNWNCFASLHGVVTVILDEQEYICASVFGRSVGLSAELTGLSELSRARVNKAMGRLNADLERIHQGRSGGVHGNICDYMEREQKEFSPADD